MKPTDIHARFGGISIHPPPLRELAFDLTLEHRLDQNVIPIRSDVKLRLQGLEIVRGDVLEYSTARIDPAVIPTNDSVTASLRFTLRPEALHWVEDRRGGRDLDYIITCSVRGFVQDPQTMVLTGPYEFYLESRGNHQIAGRIPQSDWIDFLRQLGHTESVLIELPLFASNSRYPAARTRFDEALDHLRRGEWDAAMASCRRMFEALAADMAEDKAAPPNPRLLREFFEPNSKGDALNATVREFGNFLHLARHEQGLDSGIRMTARDAHAAVVISGEFLRYCERRS